MRRFRAKLYIKRLRRSVKALEAFFYRTRCRWRLYDTVMAVVRPIHAARFLQQATRRYWDRRATHLFRGLTYVPIPIQCLWRSYAAKNELVRQRREKMMRMIQRAARKKLARIHLWQAVATRHYTVIWIQRRMRRIWLRRSARMYWIMLRYRLGEMMCILSEKLLQDGQIAEGRKIYKLLEFYRECGIGSKRDLQRLKTLRTYKDDAKVVRECFLHVSTHGVNNPDKAFKVSSGQFSRCLKDMGVFDMLSTPATCDIIFSKCNSNTFEEAAGAKQRPKSAKEKFSQKEEEEEDKTLEMDEFLEACVRLSRDVYEDEGDVAARLKVFVSRHIVPYVDKVKKEEEERESYSSEESSLATALTKEQEVKLKKMFKHYGGGDGDQDADVSITEFLKFAKECKLPQMGFSFTKAVDVFIDCNEAEVVGFIEGTLTESLTEVMQMDFEEFMEAIKTILLRMPRDKMFNPEKAWPKFFTAIYDACPANHLNLYEQS